MYAFSAPIKAYEQQKLSTSAVFLNVKQFKTHFTYKKVMWLTHFVIEFLFLILIAEFLSINISKGQHF